MGKLSVFSSFSPPRKKTGKRDVFIYLLPGGIKTAGDILPGGIKTVFLLSPPQTGKGLEKGGNCPFFLLPARWEVCKDFPFL